MNMGSTFDGMLQIMQFQQQAAVMNKMVKMATSPQAEQSRRLREKTRCAIAGEVLREARKLMREDASLTQEEAKRQVIDTMKELGQLAAEENTVDED